jgi:DNA repair protein RecO (recombination protein O)
VQPHNDIKNRTYKTYGIVLRSYSMRESDRLVTVLTPGFGKIKIGVRGARKIKSKLGGHLQILNHALLVIHSGSAFDIVSGAEAEESFATIKENLSLLAKSLYLMELTDAIIPEAAPHPDVYDCLLSALRLMNSRKNPDIISACSEFKILQSTGYLPELYRCVSCDTEIIQGAHGFSPRLGGVICIDCEGYGASSSAISVETLKVLRYMSRVEMEQVADLNLNLDQQNELNQLLGQLITTVLEKKLNSSIFIEHLTNIRSNQ